MQHGLRTTGAILITQGFRFAGGLFLAACLIRAFGAENYGRYAAALAIAAQLAFLSDLGIPLLLRQRIPSNDVAAARPYLAVSLLGTVGMLSVSILIARFETRFAAAPALLVAVTASVGLGGIQAGLGTLLQIANRAPVESALALIDRMGMVLVALLTGAFSGSLITAVGTIVIWRAMVAAVYVAFLPGLLWRRGTPGASVRGIARAGLPYAVNVFGTAVYQSADIMMMGFLFNPTQVGHYAAATTIFIPLTAIAAATAATTQVRLARLHALGDQGGAIDHLRAVNRWLLLLGGVLAITIAGARHPIAVGLFGTENREVEWYLLTLSFLLPLRYLNNTWATSLTASGHQASRSRAILVAAVFNLISNLVVLPVLGPRGAVLTTALTELVIFLAVSTAFGRSLARSPWDTIPMPSVWLASLFIASAVTISAPPQWALASGAIAIAGFVIVLHTARVFPVPAILSGVRDFLAYR